MSHCSITTMSLCVFIRHVCVEVEDEVCFGKALKELMFAEQGEWKREREGGFASLVKTFYSLRGERCIH